MKIYSRMVKGHDAPRIYQFQSATSLTRHRDGLLNCGLLDVRSKAKEGEYLLALS